MQLDLEPHWEVILQDELLSMVYNRSQKQVRRRSHRGSVTADNIPGILAVRLILDDKLDTIPGP